MAYFVIRTATALEELVERLVAEPRYALDTEFHRERTYYPRLALLQLAWSDGVALVDPLAVDIAPLATVLAGDGVAVLHAAQQDLEVLQRSCGTVPSRLFDTQLAAGFVGYSTPALASLLSAELKVRLPKGDRLTDWLKRPLTDDQLDYAAADVAHLLDLHDTLERQLKEAGRLEWAHDECEQFRLRPVGPVDPELAWLRLKDARHLKGTSRGVAQSVAAWRERRAAAHDQPSRYVISDLSILGIAQRPPRGLPDLANVRGLEERHRRSPMGDELLAAVSDGLSLTPEAIRTVEVDDVERRLRPAITLVSAWVAQLARDCHIDTSLLATRQDLIDLLQERPSARLSTGWRADMVGDQIGRLVHGEAALAFDGRGKLVLEPRVGSALAD